MTMRDLLSYGLGAALRLAACLGISLLLFAHLFAFDQDAKDLIAIRVKQRSNGHADPHAQIEQLPNTLPPR